MLSLLSTRVDIFVKDIGGHKARRNEATQEKIA